MGPPPVVHGGGPKIVGHLPPTIERRSPTCPRSCPPSALLGSGGVCDMVSTQHIIFTSLDILVFRASTPQEAIDLISTIIEYTPSARPSPQQACLHAFFDELRMPDTKLPSGRPLPPLEMDGEENRAGHGGHDSAAEQS
ncbi:hypothetical protein Y032_0085g1817 [Ancylostoma ceylanicum]|nr:hypothetical protein Y032_0085g1817 [Ancylostoma ceylanicum]